MSDNYTDVNGVSCPHCGALNHPNSVVCVSCGVRLDIYDEVIEHLQEQQKEKENQRREKLKQSADKAKRDEIRETRQMMYKSLKLLSLTLLILAIIVFSVGALLGTLDRLRGEQILSDYNLGKTCLVQADYLCARDAFEAVLRQTSEYPDAEELLAEARIGLAQVYVDEGQVAMALEELDALLKKYPDDPKVISWAVDLHAQVAKEFAEAGQYQSAISQLEIALSYQETNQELLERLKDYYDRWYQAELDNGNLFSAWNIRRRRDARFP